MKVFARFRAAPFVSRTGLGGFHAFLRHSVHNAVLDALRAADAAYQGTHRAVEWWDEVQQSIDSLADRFDTAWAQDMARIREAVCRVQKRVGALRWEAFRLTAIERLSGAAVADRLGMKVATVFKAKSKVQRMLREEIGRLEGPDPEDR